MARKNCGRSLILLIALGSYTAHPSTMKLAAAATLALLAPALSQDAPHCPQLKFDDGTGGKVSLLQPWKGSVLSAPLDGVGGLTQAAMTIDFDYVGASDTLTANVTYTSKDASPSSCSAYMEVGCIAATPLDYTFKIVHADDCFTSSDPSNDWKCKMFLTGDDYQKAHGFAFGLEMNYDTDPAAAPFNFRGAPLGTFFTGCGSQQWSQRALQYRLEKASSSVE